MIRSRTDYMQRSIGTEYADDRSRFPAAESAQHIESDFKLQHILYNFLESWRWDLSILSEESLP